MFEWNDGSYLVHYGIPGQKWGIRRFQNEDGSLTAAGKERYGVGELSQKTHTISSDRNKVGELGQKTHTISSDRNKIGAYTPKSSGTKQLMRISRNKNSKEGVMAKAYVNRKMREYLSPNKQIYGHGISADELNKKAWASYIGTEYQDAILEIMTKEEYIKLMNEVAALSRIEYDLTNDSNYLNASHREAMAIHEAIEDKRKEIQRKFDVALNQAELHKDKKKKGVDQKVEIN